MSLTVLSACGKNKDDNKDDPPAKYSVTVTNGTGGGEYAEGATVKIKANAPETGKEFTSWTIEGVTVDDKTKAEITFTMPANAVTATANYGDVQYEFALENCTADKETAKFGEEVTFTADEIMIVGTSREWTILRDWISPNLRLRSPCPLTTSM